MQFQDIGNLPPLAIIAFGISLGILYFVTKGGFSSGQKTTPANDVSTAQVAAVIVDPSALNRGTAAIEALNVTLMETNAIGREHAKSNGALAEELDRVREELRIQREINRR
ncbi:MULTISPECIES: hypothetical protein [unclassified Rhizobium]|uniref:hypothetical protein n=1 Tax=unclassified Rhizobium TaxID=2613769 RepID=UPI000715592A|nr:MULTISPECIES: hypothetical protein [unclassified Rhizobium]KQT03227.1 hypothetical protein ASG42_24785 [Rhizobium sp. Leaf391]KQU08378.1 hypothetical protein ASG68_22575 [Rhizobium sp. Leaf453]